MIEIYLNKKETIIGRFIDLTGKQFGRLTVVARAEDRVQENGRHRIMWKCKCECGNETVCSGDPLKYGKVVSCGCFKKEQNREMFMKHGEKGTKIYGVWEAMKRRCNNKNCKAYKDYGGRGITVCDEWSSSYESFRDWMINNGYKEGLTIDRIDNDRGYCPENCRLVGCVAQANNRRSNVRLSFNGETHTVAEWSDITGITRSALYQRVSAGKSVEEVLKI